MKQHVRIAEIIEALEEEGYTEHQRKGKTIQRVRTNRFDKTRKDHSPTSEMHSARHVQEAHNA